MAERDEPLWQDKPPGGEMPPPPPPPPYGQPGTYGQPAYGQSPYGQPPLGQPPYGQPPYGQPPYGQAPPMPQPSGTATAALILGVASFFMCPLIGSVGAIVLGEQAKKEIDASNGWVTGRSSAQAGVILGWIGVVLVLLGIALFVVAAAAIDWNWS